MKKKLIFLSVSLLTVVVAVLALQRITNESQLQNQLTKNEYLACKYCNVEGINRYCGCCKTKGSMKGTMTNEYSKHNGKSYVKYIYTCEKCNHSFEKWERYL